MNFFAHRLGDVCLDGSYILVCSNCYDYGCDNCTPSTWIHSGTWDVKCKSTLIELSSFTATSTNKTVAIHWSTSSELDNAGFNLYRADSEEGPYTKINVALIPAKGSATQGAEYEFFDKDVRLWRTYFYKLEDIDLNGTATMHGPVAAMPRLLR